MTSTDEPTTSPGLRLMLEGGPLLAFFAAHVTLGFYWATGVLIAALWAALVVTRVVEKKWPKMGLTVAIFVTLLGALTIGLRDERFLKLKPTLVQGGFGLILLGGLARGKSLLKIPFGKAFELDEEGWRLLTLRMALFFLGMAALNEIVWRSASTDTWVKFKVFGILPLIFIFFMSQAGLLKRHGPEDEASSSD